MTLRSLIVAGPLLGIHLSALASDPNPLAFAGQMHNDFLTFLAQTQGEQATIESAAVAMADHVVQLQLVEAHERDDLVAHIVQTTTLMTDASLPLWDRMDPEGQLGPLARTRIDQLRTVCETQGGDAEIDALVQLTLQDLQGYEQDAVLGFAATMKSSMAYWSALPGGAPITAEPIPIIDAGAVTRAWTGEDNPVGTVVFHWGGTEAGAAVSSHFWPEIGKTPDDEPIVVGEGDDTADTGGIHFP